MPEPAPDTAARVLVVDDYEDSRNMYAEMLAFAGYRVETASDGAEALERAQAGRFDLFVLDIALPKVDGITVIRTLRSRAETMNTPIVSLSASVGENAHRAIQAAGADLVLDKPCLPDDLAAAIRALLERRRKA